jgi:DNA replication regulator DPB11
MRDIPVVTTSWIEEAYDRWIHGDVFLLEDTVESHRLLPFRGMKICITGIETADVRARIHKLAKQYGGEYLKNLDKTCTHLLCAIDSSGKIEWANKNNAEREVMRARSDGKFVPPSIHLLWEEWFWDCVHRQG